jgi:hypothetical protein
MTDERDRTEVINQIIAQGRALVQAIAAMDTSAPTDRFERQQARLLQVEYRHRLREMLRVVPAWVAEEILSAGQHIGDPSHSADDLENDRTK